MIELLISWPKRQRDVKVRQDRELTGDNEYNVEASCAEVGRLSRVGEPCRRQAQGRAVACCAVPLLCWDAHVLHAQRLKGCWGLQRACGRPQETTLRVLTGLP